MVSDIIDRIDILRKEYKNAKITVEEVLTSNSQHKDFINEFYLHATARQVDNLKVLLKKLNYLRELINCPFIISSGYRPPEHNKKVGGAENSLHCTCQAADILDPKGDIDCFILRHASHRDLNDILHRDLRTSYAIESPRYTKGWCHFQIVNATGKHIFRPYVKEPDKKNYDKRFESLKQWML